MAWILAEARWTATLEKKSLTVAKILVSAAAGWIASSALYVAGLALGASIGSTILLVVALVVAAVVAFYADAIAVSLARYLFNLIASDYDDVELEVEERVKPEEPVDPRLLKTLIKSLVKPAMPDVDVKVLVEGEAQRGDDSLPDSEELEEIGNLPPLSENGWGYVTTMYYTNGNLIVVLDRQASSTLMRVAEMGNGEKAVASNDEELIQVYDIIKKAYTTRYPDSGNAMAAYVAFKTILQLIASGYLEAPRELVEKLPFEPDEVRESILRQVEEEYS